MSAPIADGVMAATHKLVHQAMTGQWHDVPKTIEERRLLLERLSASAQPHDQPWLAALRQAMAESDAVVAQLRSSGTARAEVETTVLPSASSELAETAVDDMLSMIRGR